MAARRNWTREEHILAFNLYCKIPFGTIHMRNPKVIELAKLLGRRIGAVSYKLANFARLDPSLRARGIRGMPHGSGGELEVWHEFESNPEAFAFESESLLAKLSGRKLEDIAQIEPEDLPKEGLERERMVRTRVNQNFFRQSVLSAYDYKCCITGIAVPELLVASHIVPWAADKKHRMNPRNGLCLNALHDRAFDRKLMFLDDDWAVCFQRELLGWATTDTSLQWLVSFEKQRIRFPGKFKPDAKCIARHRTQCLG